MQNSNECVYIIIILFLILLVIYLYYSYNQPLEHMTSSSYVEGNIVVIETGGTNQSINISEVEIYTLNENNNCVKTSYMFGMISPFKSNLFDENVLYNGNYNSVFQTIADNRFTGEIQCKLMSVSKICRIVIYNTQNYPGSTEIIKEPYPSTSNFTFNNWPGMIKGNKVYIKNGSTNVVSPVTISGINNASTTYASTTYGFDNDAYQRYTITVNSDLKLNVLGDNYAYIDCVTFFIAGAKGNEYVEYYFYDKDINGTITQNFVGDDRIPLYDSQNPFKKELFRKKKYVTTINTNRWFVIKFKPPSTSGGIIYIYNNVPDLNCTGETRKCKGYIKYYTNGISQSNKFSCRCNSSGAVSNGCNIRRCDGKYGTNTDYIVEIPFYENVCYTKC